MEENMNIEQKDMDAIVVEAASVIKVLYAIMNEEDDIDAYYDKTPTEMEEIISLCNARYPEKIMASYDPIYTKFGQIFINGYNTYGIDFIKLLLKRTDEAPNLCFKGLLDIYMNSIIENQMLAMQLLSPEEREKVMSELEEENKLTDEEIMAKFTQPKE